jgi:preprotein translocase subunit SecY
MWLGEHITEHGIGNGISLLIFAGIVSRLPLGVQRMFTFIAADVINILNLLALIVIGLVVIAAVVWIQEGQRRIPVQYAKRVVGRRLYGGQSTFIPMKVNTAGVIPVIFAVSVLAFPATVAQFWQHPLAQRFGEMFGYQTATYVIIQFLLIIFFTYFYTSIQFNPADVANNMKKAGGFIPGLRPGRPTAAYLQKVLMRITLVGSIFLATVAIMPNFIMTLTGIPNVYLGGTALLIVVGVALETMKQIEAHLVMRHYQGFIR